MAAASSPLGGSELITGIGELWTVDPAREPGARVLSDAAVVIEDGLIAWIGPSSTAPATDRRTDVAGRAVLPGWVDSHSHLVFDGDRSAEFAARMAGQPYAAGGIAVTMAATRAASDERLRALLAQRVAEAVAGGTTYLETKTGYGLDVPQERRAASLAAEAVDEVTFLGAHVVPPSPDGSPTDPAAYVDLVVGPMLEAVRPFVSWADVFCEEGAFTPEQSRRVLTACREAGLGLRVHGNQLGHSGGVALAVELGAASVDHVNFVTDHDIEALAATWATATDTASPATGTEGPGTDTDVLSPGTVASGASGTVATLLPACDLSTRAPLAPARRLLDASARIAIASNCNPGTSYTSSMSFCVTTAVLQMGLSIDEAVEAATLGGALALRRHTTTPGRPAVGSIAVGHRADLHVLDAPAAIHLAYRPGMPLTWAVWWNGRREV